MVEFQAQQFSPPKNCHWMTTGDGVYRAIQAERVTISGKALAQIGYVDDFAISPVNIWTNTMTGSFTDSKVYVVRSNTNIIERCAE